MAKRLMVVFVVLASILAAGTVKLGVYRVTLANPAQIGGALLKAGDYKLVVGDAKVTLTASDGGSAIEAPVKIEGVQTKFGTTVITYRKQDGKSLISEIDLGGTKTKLIFVQ